MDVKTYDPLKVNLVVKGVTITGFADGSIIEVERNEDAISPYVGTKGEVAIAESADKTGTFKITLTSGEVLFIVNTLFRCRIGYDINTDAVRVYNGKMAVAPRFFA